MIRWIVIALALVVGFALISYDRGTDDTGIEVGLLIGLALLFTLAAPRVQWAVALAIALPMAMFNGSIVALVFSSLGAGIGTVVRRSLISRAG